MTQLMFSLNKNSILGPFLSFASKTCFWYENCLSSAPSACIPGPINNKGSSLRDLEKVKRKKGIQPMPLRTFCIVLITLVVIGTLNAGWSQAATYYVATTGSDGVSCATAQTIGTPKRNLAGASGGLSCLSSGDTLDIRAGTYTEDIRSQLNNYPNGTSWATATTIKGHAGETVQINGGMAFSSGVIHRYFIMDNLVFNGGTSGFFLGAETDHIRLTNSEIKNAGRQGLDGTGDSHEIINVKIHDSGQDSPWPYHSGYGVYWRGTNTLFERMEVYNNPGYGFHIYSTIRGVNGNTVRYSKIYTNGGAEGSQFGLLLSSGSNNKAYGNLIYGNTGGIDVSYDCTNCLVYNNTVYNNNIIRGNVKTPNNYDGIHIGTGINTIIKNNILYGNYGSNTVNTATGTNTTASNNLSTNPSFVNAASGDFHLQASSPAIGAGTAIPGITITDFSGAALPQSASIDIGAFQSKVNSVSPPPAPSSLAIGFLP